ncbi:WAT1-related protein At2g39510 [Syzygium oleosum]|uniref:WAT1-related protein At2g39510 n=1 Tax=Syzygium oleosum TaxID=219896 RepID=UPI0011D209DB|nr:WAT1-related protein At2g39510 [Syzygium oleosum]
MGEDGERVVRVLNRVKLYLAVVLLQFGLAGMAIVAKFSFNKGMSQHVFVVYRHASATVLVAPFAILFERKTRPKMTRSILWKILLLGLLEPVIDQNLYYTGMKLTTASFTAAMSNMLPAFAFLMAWFFGLERLSIRSKHSQAKIVGTLVTIGGAMLMTLAKGPVLGLPWTESTSTHADSDGVVQKPIEGALMITLGCFCWASFFILQAITLKSYPAELTLTALICLTGTCLGAVFAFAMERSNFAAWSLQFDVKLLAVVYGGIVCSGMGYYIQGVVMQVKGPVFVTAFNPLQMVLVAILGSFTLHEILYLGRVIGALVIVLGLYLVLWGKSKDQPATGSSEKQETLNLQLANTSFADGNAEAAASSYVIVDVTKVRPTEAV